MTTLYQLVRDALDSRGGACSREELLAAIEADPDATQRLRKGQGFSRLLRNMKHSGFITIDGPSVRRTARRVGRRHL